MLPRTSEWSVYEQSTAFCVRLMNFGVELDQLYLCRGRDKDRTTGSSRILWRSLREKIRQMSRSNLS